MHLAQGQDQWRKFVAQLRCLLDRKIPPDAPPVVIEQLQQAEEGRAARRSLRRQIGPQRRPDRARRATPLPRLRRQLFAQQGRFTVSIEPFELAAEQVMVQPRRRGRLRLGRRRRAGLAGQGLAQSQADGLGQTRRKLIGEIFQRRNAEFDLQTRQTNIAPGIAGGKGRLNRRQQAGFVLPALTCQR